jgi:hypothetical protein
MNIQNTVGVCTITNLNFSENFAYSSLRISNTYSIDISDLVCFKHNIIDNANNTRKAGPCISLRNIWTRTIVSIDIQNSISYWGTVGLSISDLPDISDLKLAIFPTYPTITKTLSPAQVFIRFH